MRELKRRDLEDIANGACILASGGGGSIAMVEGLIGAIGDRPVRLCDLAEVGDEERVVVSAGAGSPEKAAGGSKALAAAAVKAIDEAERDLGVTFSYTAAIETGVANTLLPMVTAVEKGIGVLDGAGARRSVPSLTMCTYDEVEIPPMEMVSIEGKVVTVQVPYARDAEQPMMAIASTDEFSHQAGLAFWPMDGRQAKEHTGAGTVSYAQQLGEILRQSKGADPVSAVTDYLGGYVLFEGTIGRVEKQTTGSFDFVTVTLENESGETFLIMVQNESLIAWSCKRPYPMAMGPDLICYLGKDGAVFSNADLDSQKGKTICVIGAPAEARLRKPGIIQSFLAALQNLGYGGPYVPIEKLQALPMPDEHHPIGKGAQPAHIRWQGRFQGPGSESSR